MLEIEAITREEPTNTGHPTTQETHNRYEHENDKEKQKMQQGGDVDSKISGIIAMKPYSNNWSKTATKMVEVEGGMDGGC